jgi:hypothetical protein
VCDWDGKKNGALPTCTAKACPGHAELDVHSACGFGHALKTAPQSGAAKRRSEAEGPPRLPQGGKSDDGGGCVLATNKAVYAALHPLNDLPYTYDNYDWEHCAVEDGEGLSPCFPGHPTANCP